MKNERIAPGTKLCFLQFLGIVTVMASCGIAWKCVLQTVADLMDYCNLYLYVWTGSHLKCGSCYNFVFGICDSFSLFIIFAIRSFSAYTMLPLLVSTFFTNCLSLPFILNTSEIRVNVTIFVQIHFNRYSFSNCHWLMLFAFANCYRMNCLKI